MSELGDRIRRVREALVLTQDELAEKLEMPTRSLQAYEAGAATPRPARRRKILRFLDRHESKVAA